MDTPESDEIVAAVLARAEDEVGLPRNEQGHSVIEEPGGKRRRIAVDDDGRVEARLEEPLEDGDEA